MVGVEELLWDWDVHELMCKTTGSGAPRPCTVTCMEGRAAAVKLVHYAATLWGCGYPQAHLSGVPQVIWVQAVKRVLADVPSQV